jgi:hypothetical protein
MNEKTLRALVCAGAVKRMRIIGDGSRFHVEVDTLAGAHVAQTMKGRPRTWGSLDATAKWLRSIGVGSAQLDVTHWNPLQRSLRI